MPCDDDPCPECGASRNWKEHFQYLQSQVSVLSSQLAREVAASEAYSKMFDEMKADRDAWKEAYLDLKSMLVT